MANIDTLGIDKLRFFTGDGNEINMEKQYSVEWEIVPSEFTYKAFLKNPKGHFEINQSDEGGSVKYANVVVDEGGLIKSSLTFTPYVSDEHYLYNIYNDIISTSEGDKLIEFANNIGNSSTVISFQCLIGSDITLTSGKRSITNEVIATLNRRIYVKCSSDISNPIIKDNNSGNIITLSFDESKDLYYFTINNLSPVSGIYNVTISHYHEKDNVKDITDTIRLYILGTVESEVLSDTPNYIEIQESELSSDYKYSITDQIGRILFFSYRATNKEDITKKQYLGIFSYSGALSNDIIFEKNITNYSFVCNVTAGCRVLFIHSLDVYMYIIKDDYTEVQEEHMLTSIRTIDDRVSKHDGIMYVSYSSSDSDFTAYRFSDRYVSNILRITINNGEESITTDFNLVDILQTTSSKNVSSNYDLSLSSSSSSDFLDETAYTDILYSINNKYSLCEYLFSQTTLTSCSFDYDDSFKGVDNMSAAYYIMRYNVDENQYPYVKYIGSIMQDKVSTDLISATTIVIVNDKKTNSDDRFTYPIIKDDDLNKTYQIHFKFLNNSEMSFITSNDNVNLSKTNTMFMPLTANSRSVTLNSSTYERENAMHFTVGLQTDTEGCYQNTMGMFIRDVDTDIDYFFGIIIFNTEVIDEDERYRTLFTNFGIPDPIKYPNIFKSLEPDEEATDWLIVNQKSKQLFLSYDLIFPYVGTYKALFNAVKFLGYEDIIFKEWYKIKDTFDNNKYVAIQTYDLSTGTSLSSVLKNYGIEYGEYERYTKLNRLSMVYHINQLSETENEELLPLYDSSSHTLSDLTFYNHLDIPSQYNIYEYRNDEVLAKLYSVKKWLEHYITGVNCYISDINAEGVILDRIKTIGYVTEHEFKDIQNKGYFTPNTRCTDTSFIDSSATITCSLNEFDSWLWEHESATEEVHSGVTFNDYKDYSISQFVKQEHTVKLLNPSTNITVYESCPIGAMTVADEYEFVVNINNADSGSLYEFTSNDSSNNPILLDDGEITFFDLTKSLSEIETDEAPVILIRRGNIRETTGSWTAESILNTNIKYSIALTIDANGNSYYVMTKFPDASTADTSIIHCKANVTFSPDDNATLKYSTNNQWNVPLFEMSHYTITNQMRSEMYDSPVIAKSLSFFDSSNNTYILEIIDGEMKFSNSHKNNIKDCTGASLLFGENVREEGGGEQVIKISYTYKSDRVPIYNCKLNFNTDSSKFNDFKTCCSSLDSNIDITNTRVNIPVNRIGDYQVQVNAYDGYNNIFCSSDDDVCTITSKIPDIDIITNQSDAENSSDFYRFNKTPEMLSLNDTSALVHSIDDYIVFPIQYKLYNVEHNLDDSQITYDNISYAIDTPKANDYIMLTNLTEQVIDVSVDTTGGSSGNLVTVKTKRGNLGKLNFLANQRVLMCVYDDNLQEVLWKTTSQNNIIQSITDNDKRTSIYSGLDECTITIQCSPTDDIQDYVSMINDNTNNINLYLISTPHLDINASTEIINFYDSSNNRRCFIPLSEHTHKGSYDTIDVNSSVLTMKYTDTSTANGLTANERAYVLIYDYTTSKQLWLSNKMTIDSIDTGSKIVTFKQNTLLDITDDIIDEVNNDENVRAFLITDLQHIDDDIDAFEDSYSEDITLRHFPLDTMIKIRASIGDNIINETAYRIVDTSIYNYIDNINPTNNVIKCGYVLDGHIDLQFLNNLKNRNTYKNNGINNSSIYQYNYLNDITYTMMPLHTKPVQYCLRVNENATETVYPYNEGNFYAMDTTVSYNSKQLLFDSYFDDSYAMSIFDYDPIAGKEIWDSSIIEDLYDSSANIIIDDSSLWANMYKYTNHPVTIDLNRIVIVKTDENMTQLESGFKNEWWWKVKTIENNDNWSLRTHNVENVVLFKSVNDKLCVRPYMIGSLSIELYCTDKYGNIISNTGGGNIYVK